MCNIVFVVGFGVANGRGDNTRNKLACNVVYILIQRAFMPIAIKEKV